ncbi:MAG: DUF3786 domain-containing protein [Anaerolineales bacterium]|nr:DUF3786 domain-containing protein [Anaerolineales bacterium]
MSESLVRRVDELRSGLCLKDPVEVSERVGLTCTALDTGSFDLSCLFVGESVILRWPEMTVARVKGGKLPVLYEALIFYYLFTGDGTPMSGKRISFAGLPDGRIYNQAFQEYTGVQLVKKFREDVTSFKDACQTLGGQPVEGGQASFLFQALPRLPVQVIYWQGDEDFASNASLLFDETACHYLPVDGCAILGNLLTRKLINIKGGVR